MTDYTHDHVRTAIDISTDMVSGLSEDGGDAASLMSADAIRRLPDSGPVTWDAVSGALNGAANDASGRKQYENAASIRDDSARDLAVNAALYLLDHPDADLPEIIAAQYADSEPSFDDLEEDDTEPSKGSEEWNEALYETVTGWIWLCRN